jgi:hypothetical protein
MSVQVAPLPAQTAGREVFFKLAIGFGILILAFEIGYLVKSPWPFDPIGYLVGRDFVNAWLGAKLALAGDPAPHFSFDAYQKLLQGNFGADYPIHIWSYPPHLLLFTWPLGLMPYLTAYAVYTLFGLILYLAVASEGSRRLEHLAILILAPAVTINIWAGQNGFITAALLIGGLTQLDRRPVLAGILFGLLSIKPQLGVLMPLMLLLTGRWRVIVAAAVTIAVLVIATALIFGGEVWIAYLRDAMPPQRRYAFEGFSNFMMQMPTPFMNAKVAGLPLWACFAVQGIVSAVTLAAVVWTFWRKRDPVLSVALFVTAVFTVTPYAFNYDMVVFGWVIITLMDRRDNAPLDYALMLLVFATPALTVVMGMTGVMPFSSLPLIAFGARLWWRMAREQTASRPVTSA